MKAFKFIFHFFVFILLTILTQVGGIIFLFMLCVSRWQRLCFAKSIALFGAAYLLSTFIVIPFIAPIFGRTSLPIRGSLKPLNLVTCLLNRHYVKAELKEQLLSIAEAMESQFEGTQTHYLDANFPFYQGFPLFPHLSHDDGKKVDLAFYYIDSQKGEKSDTAPSWIGYGIYDAPVQGEINYPERCAKQGFWQYSLLSYVVPKEENKLRVDTKRTKALIVLLASDSLTSKIFLEPHLKERWALNNYHTIRFHGCQAVRHDDHIHTQIR